MKIVAHFFRWLTAFMIVCATIWASLAIAFTIQRLKCTPILDLKCRIIIWNKFGDFILLKWVSDKGAFVIGIFTISAAILTAIFLFHQIKQSDFHEDRRRRNKYMSLKSTLSIHLDILSVYINSYITQLSLIANSPGDSASPVEPDKDVILPQSPDSTISFLAQIIEYSEESTEIIVQLISWLQIVRARIRSFYNNDGELKIKTQAYGYIIDAIIAKSIVDNLYHYARYPDATIPSQIEWDYVLNSIEFNNLIDYPYKDDVIKIANGRKSSQGQYVKIINRR